MIQFEIPYKITTNGLAKYLKTSNEWILKLLENYETRIKIHSVMNEDKIFANWLRYIILM